MSASPERALRRALEAAGLNAWGVVSGESWDACVAPAFRLDALGPDARVATTPRATVGVVVGAGGRSLFEAFRAAPEARLAEANGLDDYTVRVVEEAAATVLGQGFAALCVFAHRPRAGVFADFVALGRAAGLGWPSRLRLLLHPDFGPWMSLRAAILTDAPLALSASLT